MATAPVTSAEVTLYEYLHTDYSPDREYVDGAIEERNLGEFDHQAIQRALLLALSKMERERGFYTALELRVQVAPDRFRIPDLCLLPASHLPERIVTEAPLLCIEVLSPEDRFSRTRQKCEDYLRMGVPQVWIFDPEQRVAYVLGKNGVMTEHRDGRLPAEAIGVEVLLSEIFSGLDRVG